MFTNLDVDERNRTAIMAVMRLLQFTDSTLPVGAFAFSNSLESAVQHGVVHDADTLEAYVETMAELTAESDSLAALHAYRACIDDDYDTLQLADRRIILCKLNGEARLMTRRMGRKLTELAVDIMDHAMLKRWLSDIEAGCVEGCYPTTLAVVMALCGVNEVELFCSLQYGAINMALGAALRCMRVSHYQTQRILFRMGDNVSQAYERVHRMSLDDMNAFAPQIDLMASLHEKGTQRMFMN